MPSSSFDQYLVLNIVNNISAAGHWNSRLDVDSLMRIIPSTALIIETEPSGASIYLNGVLQGTSSLTASNVSAGTYSYTASLSGYYTYSSETVVATGTNNLSIVLVAQQLSASEPDHVGRPPII